MPSSATNHGYRELAKDVILAAFASALAGDVSNELWLRESNRARIFTAGLGLDHDYLMQIFDEYKVSGAMPAFNITIGKKSRGRPKKVTFG